MAHPCIAKWRETNEEHHDYRDVVIIHLARADGMMMSIDHTVSQTGMACRRKPQIPVSLGVIR
jgi:hypothetical protein